MFSLTLGASFRGYQANRKGPQNQVGAGTTTGLFGSSPATSSATGLFSSSTTNSGFAYGQNKTAFGTSKHLTSYWALLRRDEQLKVIHNCHFCV